MSQDETTLSVPRASTYRATTSTAAVVPSASATTTKRENVVVVIASSVSVGLARVDDGLPPGDDPLADRGPADVGRQRGIRVAEPVAGECLGRLARCGHGGSLPAPARSRG